MERHRSNDKNSKQRRWFTSVVWAIFGAGLLVQLWAPGLQIKNRAFVIPPSPESHAQRAVSPTDLVARERLMQALSAILTLTGAVGLAVHYRRVFLGSRSL